MTISALTPRDDALAAVASDMATRLFPELPGGWRIGGFQNQVVQESRLLFLGDGFLEIGRVTRLEIPGVKEPLLTARVWSDYALAVSGHALIVNFLGLCRVEDRFILTDVDLPADQARAVMCHEICHGVLSMFPPHGSAWRDRMRAAAQTARDMDLDALGFALDAGPSGWKFYRPSLDAPADSEVPDVFLDSTCARWVRARQRFKIVLSDGVSLADWLDARRAAGWGPE